MMDIFEGPQLVNGVPNARGQVFSYISGSFSHKQPTFSDEALTVENDNPIVLNNDGTLPINMYVTPGVLYNFVMTADDGTTVLWVQENYSE